jgi:hypothetical protein
VKEERKNRCVCDDDACWCVLSVSEDAPFVVHGCDGEADGSWVKVGMEVLGGGVRSSPCL